MSEWTLREAAEPGQGIPNVAKHCRLELHPPSGRMYNCGGDWAGGDGHAQSYRQELWSVDLRTMDWRLEYPYWPAQGELHPAHPDQVGWCWDGSRFLMLPGFQGSLTASPTGSIPVRSEVMSFDTTTKRWDRRPEMQQSILYGNHLWAVYHEGAVYRFTNNRVHRWAGGAWQSLRVTDLGTAHSVARERPALSSGEGRIYLAVVDPAKLVAYDIEHADYVELGPLPDGRTSSNEMQIVHAAGALWWPQRVKGRLLQLWRYDEDGWNAVGPESPTCDGHPIRGSIVACDGERIVLWGANIGAGTVSAGYFTYELGGEMRNVQVDMMAAGQSFPAGTVATDYLFELIGADPRLDAVPYTGSASVQHTFTNVQPGTGYTVRVTLRDGAAQALGSPVTSAPFDVDADVVLQVPSGLTVQVITA